MNTTDSHRKVAFLVGYKRYWEEKLAAVMEGEDPDFTQGCEKTAMYGLGDIIKAGALTSLGIGAAVGLPSYLAGRGLGSMAKQVTHPELTNEDVDRYQYELADKATQRLIDELKAKQSNQALSSALKEEKQTAETPFAGYL